MNTVTQRMRRMMDLLRREIAKIIREELNDPRIGQVTVTDVILAKDFSSAKIYISSLEQNTVEDSVLALNHAHKRIRSLIAHRIEMRIVPSIAFKVDQSILHGDHLIQLINDNLKTLPKDTQDIHDHR